MHQLPTAATASLSDKRHQQLLEVKDKRFTLFFKVCHPILALLPPCLDFFDSRPTILFLFIWVCAVASGGPVKEQSIQFFFGLPGGGFDIRSASTPHRNLTTIHRCLACSLRRSLLKTCSEISSVRVPRVVKVGHRFFYDNIKFSQSSAS